MLNMTRCKPHLNSTSTAILLVLSPPSGLSPYLLNYASYKLCKLQTTLYREDLKGLSVTPTSVTPLVSST